MKTVKFPKLLMTALSAMSGCLTKMELVLIFVLSMTAGYAVKMEMLIADGKELSSPTALIETSGVERDSANVNQSIAMLEQDLHQKTDKLRFMQE